MWQTAHVTAGVMGHELEGAREEVLTLLRFSVHYLQVSQSSKENKPHRHSIRASSCVCLCMCLKPDNPVPVPSTKFTSVLTELSGLPSERGGDRQCISSLGY